MKQTNGLIVTKKDACFNELKWVFLAALNDTTRLSIHQRVRIETDPLAKITTAVATDGRRLHLSRLTDWVVMPEGARTFNLFRFNFNGSSAIFLEHVKEDNPLFPSWRCLFDFDVSTMKRVDLSLLGGLWAQMHRISKHAAINGDYLKQILSFGTIIEAKVKSNTDPIVFTSRLHERETSPVYIANQIAIVMPIRMEDTKPVII